MAQTNTTTLATTLPTEFIAAEVLREARPFNVVAPHVTNDVLPSGQGKTWAMQKLPTTTAAAIHSVAEGLRIERASRSTDVSSDVCCGSRKLSAMEDRPKRSSNHCRTWAGSTLALNSKRRRLP